MHRSWIKRCITTDGEIREIKKMLLRVNPDLAKGNRRIELLRRGLAFLRRPARLELLICALLLAPPVLSPQQPNLPGQGLTLTAYRGGTLDDEKLLGTFWAQEPSLSFRDDRFPPLAIRNNISFRFEGYLAIPEDGSYRFGVRVDDGVRILIDNIFLFDDWKAQRDHTKFATLSLKKGRHHITIDYLQASGDAVLQLFWKPPGSTISSRIPASAFFMIAQP